MQTFILSHTRPKRVRSSHAHELRTVGAYLPNSEYEIFNAKYEGLNTRY